MIHNGLENNLKSQSICKRLHEEIHEISNYCTCAIISRSWILTIHKDRILSKSLLEYKEMVSKMGWKIYKPRVIMTRMVFKSENLENLRVEEEVQLWLHKVFDTIVYWFCQQTILNMLSFRFREKQLWTHSYSLHVWSTIYKITTNVAISSRQYKCFSRAQRIT